MPQATPTLGLPATGPTTSHELQATAYELVACGKAFSTPSAQIGNVASLKRRQPYQGHRRQGTLRRGWPRPCRNELFEIRTASRTRPPAIAVECSAVTASPLTFIFALELGLALAGALWMRLAGYAFFPAPRPLQDTLYFLAGYLVLLALERLTELLAPAAYRELDALMRQLGRLLRASGVGYASALALALASALGEELFFRGALQNALGHVFGPWGALVLQAALFALGHPAPGRAGRLYALWAFAAGLVFGGLYLLSGSLMPGILAHFLYNAKGFAEFYEEPGPASR